MSDDRLPWFPCYPSKLLGALAGMPPSHGYIYWIVCLRIYEVGGPCMDTLDAIARRTGFNKRVTSDALDALFRSGKLVRQDGGIINPFAAEVIEDSRSLLKKRKTAGREGGLRTAEKYKQKQQNRPSKATAELQHSYTHLHLQEQDSLFTDVNRAPPEGRKAKPKPPPTPLEIERKELFDRGKTVLGDGAGGLIQQLLAVKHGNVALARAAVEQASTMDNPRQYVGGILRAGGPNGKTQGAGDRIGFAGIAARVRHGTGAQSPPDDPAPGGEPDHRR